MDGAADAEAPDGTTDTVATVVVHGLVGIEISEAGDARLVTG